jgi:hypothetical protein
MKYCRCYVGKSLKRHVVHKKAGTREYILYNSGFDTLKKTNIIYSDRKQISGCLEQGRE